MEYSRKFLHLQSAVWAGLLVWSSTHFREHFVKSYAPKAIAGFSTASANALFESMRLNIFFILGLTLFLAHAHNAAVRAGVMYNVLANIYNIYALFGWATTANGFSSPLIAASTDIAFAVLGLAALWKDYLSKIPLRDVLTHNFPHDEDEEDEKPHAVLSVGVLLGAGFAILVYVTGAFNQEAFVARYLGAAGKGLLKAPLRDFAQHMTVQHVISLFGFVNLWYHVGRNGANSLAGLFLFRTVYALQLMTSQAAVGPFDTPALNPVMLAYIAIIVYGLSVNVGGNVWSNKRTVFFAGTVFNLYTYYLLFVSDFATYANTWLTADATKWSQSPVGQWNIVNWQLLMLITSAVDLVVTSYNDEDTIDQMLLIRALTFFSWTIVQVYGNSVVPTQPVTPAFIMPLALNLLLPLYLLRDQLRQFPSLIKGLFHWSWTPMKLGVYTFTGLNVLFALRGAIMYESVVDEFIQSNHTAVWTTARATQSAFTFDLAVIILNLTIYLTARNSDQAVNRAIDYITLAWIVLHSTVTSLFLVGYADEWKLNPISSFWLLGVPAIKVTACIVGLVYQARADKQKED